MRYCLKSRQKKELLAEADEIRVAARDYRQAVDLMEEYPTARIIVDIDDLDIKWNILQTLNEKYPGRLALCLAVGDVLEEFKNFEYFFSFYLNTWQDLNSAVSLGINEGFIGAPLFFQQDKIKERYPNFKVRAIPNRAATGNVARANFAHGTWIRPEDTEFYEPYVSCFEFASPSAEIEETVYKIYKRREWRGNINVLIPQLDYNTNNQFIAKEIMPTRLNCNQTCETRNSCHLCDTALKWQSTIEEYRRQKEEKRTIKSTSMVTD